MAQLKLQRTARHCDYILSTTEETLYFFFGRFYVLYQKDYMQALSNQLTQSIYLSFTLDKLKYVKS